MMNRNRSLELLADAPNGGLLRLFAFYHGAHIFRVENAQLPLVYLCHVIEVFGGIGHVGQQPGH